MHRLAPLLFLLSLTMDPGLLDELLDALEEHGSWIAA